MLNTYRNDINLFVQRIDAAVKAAADHPEVDADKIGIIGYCFGETFLPACLFCHVIISLYLPTHMQA